MNEALRRPLPNPVGGDVVWSKSLIYPILVMAVGGAAALVSSLVGALLLVIGFAWLAYRSIPIGLAAYIVMAPIPLEIIVHAHKLFVSDAMAVLLMAIVVWTIRANHEQDSTKPFRSRLWETFFPESYRWALIVLLGLSFLSLAVALSHSGTVIKLLEYIEFFVVIIGIARFTGRSRSAWALYFYALLSIAGVLSLIGIFQFLVGAGPISNQIAVFHVRATSIFGQPNPFGGFDADIFPMIAALVVVGPKDVYRRWLTAGLVVIALGVVISYSRGAWAADMAAVVAMIVLGYVTKGKRILIAMAEYAMVIPVALFVVADLVGKVDLKPLYHHWVASAKPLADGVRAHHALTHAVVKVAKAHPATKPVVLAHANAASKLFSLIGVLFHPKKYYDVQQRLIIWRSAWQAFVKHPILGVGLGNFHLYIQAHRPKHLVGGIPPMAHDLYLEWAADLGIGGFVVAFWLEWRWLVSGIRAVRQSVADLDEFWYAVTLGAFGTVVAFVVQNFIDLLIDHGVIVPFLLAVAVLTLAIPARKSQTS